MWSDSIAILNPYDATLEIVTAEQPMEGAGGKPTAKKEAFQQA